MTKKDIFSEYSPGLRRIYGFTDLRNYGTWGYVDKRDLSFEQRAVSKNASLNTKQIKIS